MVGRAVLQSGGLGGGDSNSQDRKVSVVLPTFGPIDDDEDYDDEDEATTTTVATPRDVDVRAGDLPSGNVLSARIAEDSTSTANSLLNELNEIDATSVKERFEN